MSEAIPCDADASTLKAAIENFDNIHNVAVSRSSVSIVGGYSWTVSFIDEETKSQRGDIPELKAHSSLFGGSGYPPTLTVGEFRKGTQQEVQVITIEAGDLTINSTSSFRIRFKGEVTNDINVLSLNGTTCSAIKAARQVITTSTDNLLIEGGDFAVSPLTQFSLVYHDVISERIFATSSSCDEVASHIKQALEAMPQFQHVSLSSNDGIAGRGSCRWEITFDDYLGNPDLLQG